MCTNVIKVYGSGNLRGERIYMWSKLRLDWQAILFVHRPRENEIDSSIAVWLTNRPTHERLDDA